jgi:hypothetical protein
MAEAEMVVLSDIWVGVPHAHGSLFLRKGSVVTVDPADAGRIAELGGSGNLRRRHQDGTSDGPGHAERGAN